MKQPQTAMITLKWEGVVVGYISILNPGAQLVGMGSNHTESLQRRSDIVDSGKARIKTQDSLNTTQISNDQSLTVSFIATGPALTADNVLITVLYSLVYASQFKSSEKAEAFELRLPGPYNMYLGMIGAVTAAPSPFLQWRWVIETLDKIPQYMLYQGVFSGATFKMQVGSTEVGQGQMLTDS